MAKIKKPPTKAKPKPGAKAKAKTKAKVKKPTTVTDKGLNERHLRFIDEYLIDLNGAQAAIRAGYAPKAAKEQASRLLTDANIKAELAKRQEDLGKRTEITQEMVLKRWWQIATADPRNLVEVRRHCCRYCYGASHLYQWTEGEYTQACNKADLAETPHPDCSGGFGYDKSRMPYPQCPECSGQGVADVFIHDTSKLDEASALLYAGAKNGRNGIEVQIHDPREALNNVARHLGMFNDKLSFGVQANNPLADFMATLASTAAIGGIKPTPDNSSHDD